MTDTKSSQIMETAREYLATLSPAEAEANEQDIYNFARWCTDIHGTLAEIEARDIDLWVEKQSITDSKYADRMKHVRAFLDYVFKQQLTTCKLSAHLKPRKTKTRSGSSRQAAETVTMTREGYEKMKVELVTLKEQRDEAIHEIQKAAADKDFRENAPLEAAREHHGQLMGRIREIEELIKCAVVSDGALDARLRVNIGNTVVLVDASGKESRYTIVSPREVNPKQGRISNASPVGKAVLGQEQGKEIEVVTPGGKLKYKIKEVVR